MSLMGGFISSMLSRDLSFLCLLYANGRVGFDSVFEAALFVGSMALFFFLSMS